MHPAACGGDRFRAHSAGSHPRGVVHPEALELLRSRGYSTEGLRSKHWDEFARLGAPELDFVFTVCDTAAGETCPIWPGQPLSAHWGIEDPAVVQGDQQRRAFLRAYTELKRRIELFLELPLATLNRFALQRELEQIGKG